MNSPPDNRPAQLDPPTIERLDATGVFNLFLSESMLMLDCSAEAAHTRLPGAVWVDLSQSASAAADVEPPLRAALAYALDELAPDKPREALVLAGAEPALAERCAQLLLSLGQCTRVRLAPRSEAQSRFPFIFCEGGGQGGLEELPFLPNEVLADQLFLGSRATVNARALGLLRMSHVVSVVTRAVQLDRGISHLMCEIEDAPGEDLGPVLDAALPFIARAIEQGGRVLVHCDRGASRSVSVVLAHLLQLSDAMSDAGHARQFRSVDDALRYVKGCRPCAAPNPGFMAQLNERCRWPSRGL
jgi:predicted protein tyrosine phosphatase